MVRILGLGSGIRGGKGPRYGAFLLVPNTVRSFFQRRLAPKVQVLGPLLYYNGHRPEYEWQLQATSALWAWLVVRPSRAWRGRFV